jgi:hypothetical protein
MHTGKQVTKEPQKKVGVPQKKGRSEEGKRVANLRFHAESASSRGQPGRRRQTSERCERWLTRLGSARRWAWRQRDRAAQRQRDGQDTHRSAPLIVLAPSGKIQLPAGPAGADKGSEREGNR